MWLVSLVWGRVGYLECSAEVIGQGDQVAPAGQQVTQLTGSTPGKPKDVVVPHNSLRNKRGESW